MTAPLCFIDTETTGVHPDRQVWEVAMICRDDKGEEETTFFVDVDLSQADPFGLKVGRFYDRHPYGQFLSGLDNDNTPRAWSPKQAAEIIACWTHGAHIVGAVPNFDTETLAPLLRDHGYLPAWHYHLIDVEALAVGYLAHLEQANMAALREVDPNVQFKPSLATPPWTSDTVSRALNVEPASEDERHTALGDARWAMRLYDAVMGGVPA